MGIEKIWAITYRLDFAYTLYLSVFPQAILQSEGQTARGRIDNWPWNGKLGRFPAYNFPRHFFLKKHVKLSLKFGVLFIYLFLVGIVGVICKVWGGPFYLFTHATIHPNLIIIFAKSSINYNVKFS